MGYYTKINRKDAGVIQYGSEDNQEFAEYLHKESERLYVDGESGTGMGHQECQGDCGASVGPAAGGSEDYICRKGTQ